MLQQELVGEFTGMQGNIEIDAAVCKCVETHGWRQIDFVVDALHDLVGDFQRYPFNLFEVAVIAYADRDCDRDILLRHTVVGEYGSGDFLVRYDNDVAGAGEDGGETPGDIRYPAFIPGIQADVVIDAQLLGKDEMQSREEIGEGILQTEGYGHTTNAQSSDDRCNRYAAVFEDDEDAHRIDDDADDIREQ